MQKEKDLILCTSWERVAGDEFYLSYEWEREESENIKKGRELQKEGNLYYGYIVPAVDYAIYLQMDAHQVLIDNDFNIIVNCESAVIDNKQDKAIEFSY